MGANSRTSGNERSRLPHLMSGSMPEGTRSSTETGSKGGGSLWLRQKKLCVFCICVVEAGFVKEGNGNMA